jgi:hypothetical protein
MKIFFLFVWISLFFKKFVKIVNCWAIFVRKCLKSIEKVDLFCEKRLTQIKNQLHVCDDCEIVGGAQ